MSFEKFTDKARKVLVLAQDEARALHQPYVGTEHILLGLIKEKDGLAAQALDRLNVKYDDVVSNIRQVVAIDEAADVSGHLSFTPRCSSASPAWARPPWRRASPSSSCPTRCPTSCAASA